MHAPVLVTPPAIQPVTLAEAKAQCRVEDASEDTLIGVLIDAATAHFDGWTGVLGRCLAEQTWRQDFDSWARPLRLPLWPVISVTSVTYLDANGDSQTVASANYTLRRDAGGAVVDFLDTYDFPTLQTSTPAAVSVTYVAGYADSEDETPVSTAPAPIRQAMLLLIAHWHANREAVNVGASVSVYPMAVEALTAPYRRLTP